MAVALSLEDVQNQLCFCIGENAGIIYWSHNCNTFDFLLLSDQSAFRGEMLNLRNAYHDDCITSLSAGEPLGINGTQLYPMEVM